MIVRVVSKTRKKAVLNAEAFSRSGRAPQGGKHTGRQRRSPARPPPPRSNRPARAHARPPRRTPPPGRARPAPPPPRPPDPAGAAPAPARIGPSPAILPEAGAWRAARPRSGQGGEPGPVERVVAAAPPD